MTEIITEAEVQEPRAKYHAVNSQWPAEMPALTGPEAISAAKRLYRFAMKRPFKGRWKLTSGNRYSYIRNGVFYINPARDSWSSTGWHDLVHMLSHVCAARLYPKAKPHGPQHHFLEKEMVAYVLKSGWLDGRLKPKERPVPAADDRKAAKIASIEARIKRWRSKQRRATTALKKLERQQRRLLAA